MNRIIFLPCMLVAILLFASCERDGLAGLASPTPVLTSGKAELFNSSLPANLAVKQQNWSANDEISVITYLLKDSSLVNQGVRYTTNGDGKFTSSNPIAYPPNNLVNFVAFYPFKSEITNNQYPLDVSSQSNVEEFLYANSATNFNSTSQTIPNLAFQSQLSKIEINVTASAGVADINGLTISVPDVPVKANFNLLKGSLSDIELQTISPTITAAANAQNATVFALAGNDMSGKTIVVTLSNGREYTWTFPSGFVLAAGVKHAVNILLQPPFEQQLFLEKCGGTNVKVITLIKDHTLWNNSNITFSDETGRSAIRLNAAMDGNHVFLANGSATVGSFKMDGINTKYASNLKLKFSVAPGSNNSNLRTLVLKYNGEVIVLPSLALTDNTKRQTITVDLSNVAQSDTGTIEFINTATGVAPFANFRIDDFELIGTR